MICQVFARDEEMANRFVELPSRVYLLIILARRDESNPYPLVTISLPPPPLAPPSPPPTQVAQLEGTPWPASGEIKFRIYIYINIYINARIPAIIYKSRAPAWYSSLSWLLAFLPPPPPPRCQSGVVVACPLYIIYTAATPDPVTQKYHPARDRCFDTNYITIITHFP